ncbi:MAG: hypothetical protein JXQ90_02475 [Cyclobacteriaceae bacterium]
MKAYLSNCFLLYIPIIAWNVLLSTHLPESYQDERWNNIPNWLLLLENTSRPALYIIPMFMQLRWKTNQQKLGIGIYTAGLLLYFISWLLQIFFPNSDWSLTYIGFAAPAFTALFWLIGIGITGHQLYYPRRWILPLYWILTLVFMLAHIGHTWVVFY